MSKAAMVDAAPPPAMPDPEGGGWQPLPRRARVLFLLSRAPLVAAPAAGLGFVTGHVVLDRPLSVAVAALLAGALVGAWIGARQFLTVRWRLDTDGLAIRRGRLWERETRVPVTRVQHLDLTRGPLQRRRGLATLVVHTAGTRHSAVTVPNLDLADAEHLRERLGRQIDPDE